MDNPWCTVLGIDVPSLESVAGHSEANTYALLLVALLEHGQAMTLREIADAFADAGIEPAERALRSLQRCRPARPPVHRDGDRYALDPHDSELDLWAFRLGLRPPKGPRLRLLPPEPPPLPGPEVRLTIEELDEACDGAWLGGTTWTAQRLAIGVLDAHDGPMSPEDVIAFLDDRAEWHGLRAEASQYWRSNHAVKVDADGLWVLRRDHPSIPGARAAFREQLERRRRDGSEGDRAEGSRTTLDQMEQRRRAHAQELEAERRALVHVVATDDPAAIAVVDVATGSIRTFLAAEVGAVRERLAASDWIGAIDVRATLRALAFDPGLRRLAELGPPQQTFTRANGSAVRITAEMLVRGSCGIARPFGDPRRMVGDVRAGRAERALRRLRDDAASLLALYRYGHLHHAVRVRTRGVDRMLPIGWIHRDETGLRRLMIDAAEAGRWLQVVVGEAPTGDEPWVGARRAMVRTGADRWDLWIVTDVGEVVDPDDIQCARLL